MQGVVYKVSGVRNDVECNLRGGEVLKGAGGMQNYEEYGIGESRRQSSRVGQHMVRLNVALAGRNCAEKLKHFLITKFVNAADAVDQQLKRDAVTLIGQKPIRPYSAVHRP